MTSSPASRRAPSPRRRRWFAAAALIAGLLLGLALAELVIRAMLARRFGGRLEEAPTAPIGGELTMLWLGSVVHPNSNPRLAYTLKPGTRGLFEERPLRINSLEMRDAEPGERTSDTLRVASMGDSSTFGWGVAAGETYGEILEASLNRLWEGSRRVEVLNFGVPGYNAVQEAELYALRARQFRPDAALILYDLNDALAPSFLADTGFLQTRGLYVARLPELISGALFHSESLLMNFAGLGRRPPEGGPMVMDPEILPERWRPLAGWEALERAYERLVKTCAADGTPLLALLPAHSIYEDKPDLNADTDYDKFRGLANRLGLRVLDTFPETRRFALAHGLTTADLAHRPPDDMHPNAVRHALMARAILPALLPLAGPPELPPGALEAELAEIDRRIRNASADAALHVREDWGNGNVVRWSKKDSKFLVAPGGAPVKVRYWVGHPDAGEKPVKVTIRLGGGAPVVREHDAGGLYEAELTPPSTPSGMTALTVSVDRLFLESDPGRELGVGIFFPLAGVE